MLHTTPSDVYPTKTERTSIALNILGQLPSGWKTVTGAVLIIAAVALNRLGETQLAADAVGVGVALVGVGLGHKLEKTKN